MDAESRGGGNVIYTRMKYTRHIQQPLILSFSPRLPYFFHPLFFIQLSIPLIPIKVEVMKGLKGKKAGAAAHKKAKPSAQGQGKDKDVYDYVSDMIRNERNRAGASDESDDDVLKGDDESIDDDASDVGWNSEDELAFGHLFGKKKNGKRTEKDDSGEEANDDEESDQEEAHEGEMLLSDFLSSNLGSKKKASSEPAQKEKPKKKTSKVERENEDEDVVDEEEEYSVDDGDDESGEEEDDDDDGVDDDTSGSDAESSGDDDEDVSDDDSDGAAHDRLLSAIEKFSSTKTSSNETAKKSSKRVDQSALESAFSSAMDDGAAVSMEALLGALGDAKGLNVVRKQLSELEKTSKTPTFVEKVVADRVERSLAYEGTSEEMKKWQDSVVANRNVRTLDLAQDKRQMPSYKELVKKYEPTTDMEREVEMILVKTGATDDLAEQREEDELGRRNMTLEEMRERQGELAKIKALMFYEQMKRHRLNKIKSKAYRRIRKKQKMRLEAEDKAVLADADPEQARELEEEEAIKRVKERMDMKHKNTGKWARMALQHGRRDDSLRMAYHEAVQLGNELTKKMNAEVSNSRRNNDEEGDGDGDSGDSGDDENKKSGSGSRSASSRAVKEMVDVLGSYGSDQPEAQGKYKKLFEMDFMKRAVDQQKERARQEAQSILREIQMMEGNGDPEIPDSDDDNQDHDGDSGAGAAGRKNRKSGRSAEEIAAAKKHVEQKFDFGSGMMALKAGKGKIKVSGPLTVGGGKSSSIGAKKAAAEHDDGDVDNDNDGFESNPWLAAPESSKKRSADSQGVKVKNRHSEADKVLITVDNSLFSESSAAAVAAVGSSMGGKAGKKQITGGKDVTKNASTNSKAGAAATAPLSNGSAAAATAPAPGASTTAAATADASKKRSSGSERKPLLMQKSQEDLVQLAFAGPDLEEDFASYKKQTIDDELGIDEKKKKILSDVKAGWGDWAGPGATGVSQKTLKTRDRLMQKVEQESEEKRAGRRDTKTPNVILSDRRVKTASKYKIEEIPHPFTSREEYERTMQMPLGEEWNSSTVVRTNTKPDILTRAGRVIETIKLPKGAKKREHDDGGANTNTGTAAAPKASAKKAKK